MRIVGIQRKFLEGTEKVYLRYQYNKPVKNVTNHLGSSKMFIGRDQMICEIFDMLIILISKINLFSLIYEASFEFLNFLQTQSP